MPKNIEDNPFRTADTSNIVHEDLRKVYPEKFDKNVKKQ